MCWYLLMVNLLTSLPLWTYSTEPSFEMIKFWYYIKMVIRLKVTSAAKRKLIEMWHLRQKLRIFLFCGKFHSQNIQVFIFLTIHDLPNLPQLLDKPYYVKIPVFRFFWKGEWGAFKNAKLQLWKTARYRCIVIK